MKEDYFHMSHMGLCVWVSVNLTLSEVKLKAQQIGLLRKTFTAYLMCKRSEGNYLHELVVSAYSGCLRFSAVYQ